MTKPTCFMSGSRLRGARGAVAIDTILPGDEVVVLRDGQEVLEPVKWLGQTRIDLARHAAPEDAAPIRFRRDSIAPNQPERDLLVSPEHCLIIDGLCVPAKYLVNGGSIVSDRGHAPFSYYHVELEQHGILLAENVPAESYLDTGNRDSFDNAPTPRQLHPRFVVQDQSQRWKTDACAPLARVPEDITPIWTRLAERSLDIGYELPRFPLDQDADIHLLAGGARVQPSSANNGTYVFVVPASAATVQLCSNFCIPADLMVADKRDTRRLGVRVESIAIHSDASETQISADHPELTDGWHDAESAKNEMWRWTNGAATIPWQTAKTATLVTIRLRTADHYPRYDGKLQLVA